MVQFCKIEINGRKIESTPFDILKIVISFFPQGLSYDEKNVIEKWLNNLLLKNASKKI